MKTNYFIKEKSSIYTLFGLLALVVTSCGSYQNKSYYDNDGIYGGDEKRVASETNSNNAYYKEYFSSLNKENEEIFTNVDEYNSYPNDTVNRATARVENTSYSSWGSNPSSNITVNVYDNGWGYGGWNNWGWNNWGWNSWYGPGFGLGWNSWYGPGFGLGWNNWYGPGWGYYGGWYGNNWGWNNHWYGNNYAYSYGRRDSRVYNNYSAGRTSGNRIDRNINSSSRRNSNPTFTNRSTSVRNSGVRNNTSRNDSYNTTRPNNSNTTRNYNNTSTPRTNSTPRTVSPNNTPRTYSPSNSGGGRSSGGGSYGGGGGGRSSGGGGGRR